MSIVLLFVLGLALLLLGAEALVSGARRLALRMGVSATVIGLTVVAFGTSAPELVVSLRAAVAGSAEIAVGNVVGSNLFNVLVILGLAATITPLRIENQLIRIDVPLMIGVSAVTWWLVADGSFGRWEGAVFVNAIIAYTIVVIRQSRRAHHVARAHTGQSADRPEGSSLLWFTLSLVVVGLGGLTVGADLLVRGSTALAFQLGISELVVALTIVAAGTSMPEVATSVVAVFRGEREIAVSNVIGSNLFNLLAVLGASGLTSAAGIRIPDIAIRFDFAVMVVVAALCLPVFFKLTMTRWEGVLFLSYYACYTIYVVLTATQHAIQPTFVQLMIVCIPISLAGVALHAAAVVRRQRKHNLRFPIGTPRETP